jgi:hypothetical protein
MSTHEEAKSAMIHLTRTQLKYVRLVLGVHCLTSVFAEVILSISLGLSYSVRKVGRV